MNQSNCLADRYLFAKRGFTIECMCMTHSLADHSKIKRYYDAAKEKFVYWLENERLRNISQAKGSQRGINRLHIEPENWNFSVFAHPVEKYLSVCLSVSGRGSSFEQTTVERRVWDTERCILCPTAVFLPILQAKKYDKWECFLDEQTLTVMHRNQLKKISLVKRNYDNDKKYSKG